MWRAQHVAGDEWVAVKVLGTERIDEGLARAAFHTEVQAQARLDHPRIVRVRGHGFVPADQGGPQLPAGAAWLAMDLAPHGSLDRYPVPLGWPGVRGILLGLLDALAHAHARGLVHRDLKAANILVFKHAVEHGGAPDVRITDFGLAHAMGADAGGRDRLGTPRAMAPEQFRGVAADHGPWTDLYALGCLAWELVCGESVFPGSDTESQRTAHLLHEPRALTPGLPVPEGFEAWLRRCLAKTPEARFRFAADAAHALLALPAPTSMASARIVPIEGLTTLPVELGPAHTLAWALDPPADLPSAEMSALPVERPVAAPPPCPATWRVQVVGAQTSAAGSMSTFGLRRRPVVGRDLERDRAWAALLAARATRASRAVIFTGPRGVGCSRLAAWAAERWHEVGGGPFVQVDCRHGRSLERAVASLLGTAGRDAERARARIQTVLQRQGVADAYEGESLARLLGSTRPGRPDEFSTEEERWSVALRALQRAEPGRVPVLVLDDAHADPDALAFANWVLGREDAPVVLVLTLPDELETSNLDSLVSHGGLRPALGRAIASLAAHERAIELPLRPLDAVDHTALLRVLGLSGSLRCRGGGTVGGDAPARRAARRGDGSNGAGRGYLFWSEGGAWGGRFASLGLRVGLGVGWPACSGGRARSSVALWLAALLGPEVSRGSWEAACASLGSDASGQVADALCAEGLWLTRPWGWICTHALARRLEGRDSARRTHAASSGMRGRARNDGRGYASLRGSLGRHRLAAGEPNEAFQELFSAARAEGPWESRCGIELTRLAGKALIEARAPSYDPRRASIGVLEARILRLRGRPDAALRRLRPAAHIARRRGLGTTLVAALRLEGALAGQRGELVRAMELYREARGRAEAAGDLAGEASATLDLAFVAHRQGRFDEAEELSQRGLDHARRAESPRAVSASLCSLAGVARLRGTSMEPSRLLAMPRPQRVGPRPPGRCGCPRGARACCRGSG